MLKQTYSEILAVQIVRQDGPNFIRRIVPEARKTINSETLSQ